MKPMIRVMKDSLAWVAEIMARQDGVIARRQALGAGATAGQIRHRLESGGWILTHPSVYRSVEHQHTPAARVRAAGLWAGENAFLHGTAAAWWWGLPTPEPATVGVVIPRAEHRRSRPGVRVIRRRLQWDDQAWVRAAPVTSLALSVMVAAVDLGTDGPALMDRALQTKLRMSELRACYYRNLGMSGSAAIGHLVRAAADRTAAASERLFLGLLKSSAIRGWRVNYVWNPPHDERSIDVAFVRERLAIEIDGWAWHHSPDRFQRDRTKQNDLTLAGWTVLRFTWFDLTSNPHLVVHAVKQALLAATATGTSAIGAR